MSSQYCRHCGNTMNPDAIACINCGLPPTKGNNFCPACGADTHPEAIICVKCGISLVIPQPAQVASQTQSQNRNFASQPLTPPKNWLIESILVTLFCCLPAGIVGIINASKVESRFMMGDIAGAQAAADESKRWATIGLVAGLVVMVLYFVYIAAMVGTAFE